MKRDKITTFSSAQAITAAAASSNNWKMSGTPVSRDPFKGEDLWLVTTVDTAFTDSGSNSTLTVDLKYSADDVTYTQYQTAYTLPALAAVTTSAATMYVAKLGPIPVDAKYLQVYYTPNNGDLSTGAVTTFITTTPQLWSAKPSGYSITNPSSF